MLIWEEKGWPCFRSVRSLYEKMLRVEASFPENNILPVGMRGNIGHLAPCELVSQKLAGDIDRAKMLYPIPPTQQRFAELNTPHRDQKAIPKIFARQLHRTVSIMDKDLLGVLGSLWMEPEKFSKSLSGPADIISHHVVWQHLKDKRPFTHALVPRRDLNCTNAAEQIATYLFLPWSEANCLS